MDLALAVIQVVMIAGFPALAYFLANRFKVFDVVGPVLLCYAFGMLLRNTYLYPVDENISKQMYEAAVPFAIALMLLGLDFMGWLRLAKTTTISFGLAVLSVAIMATSGSYLFADMQHVHEASGMLVGVYTGGTANMAAIGSSHKVPENIYVLLNASDVVISSMYLFFLMTIAKPLLGKIFRPFPTEESDEDYQQADTTVSYWQSWRGVGLAVAIVGSSIGLAIVLTGKMSEIVIIIAVTTLGIAASFSPAVRKLPHTFKAGEYAILVFCVGIGTMTDFADLFNHGGTVFVFCAFVLVGAILVHFLLCFLFKVDVDTMLITSTAAVFSPAFVPVIAEAIKNRSVILSGMTTGILGFAVGNYVGVSLPYLLKWMQNG